MRQCIWVILILQQIILDGDNMKIFKPTPTFLYINREKWLRKMSLSGWKLISYSWWTYEFEKSSPNDLYFFLYETSVKNNKPYWVYYDVMSKYSYKKSKINVKGIKEILVIKPEKIDDEFWTYMNIRDNYVLREIIYSIILFLFFTILGIIISIVYGIFQGMFLLFFYHC